MRGDYGYMEEGELGKPYNLRLLKRLVPYALPYKKTISFGLFLSLLITLLNLAPPYLLKIAMTDTFSPLKPKKSFLRIMMRKGSPIWSRKSFSRPDSQT